MPLFIFQWKVIVTFFGNFATIKLLLFWDTVKTVSDLLIATMELVLW